MAKAATKSKTKQAPAPEPEELDEDLDLEEVDGDEVEETTSGKGSKQPEVTFGASDLARHLTETSGKAVSARELRTLIRKMARDGSKRVNREVTPGNRTRYNWSGINDPEVQAIIKAFNGGELEADKQAKLAELKERKAKQKAEAGDKPAKGKGGKSKAKGKATKAAAPAPADEDSDFDDEDLDLDED